MGMNGTPDGGISSAASGYAWLCPFGASLFYLMLNAMSWSELDERKVENPSTTTKAKAFLLCSLFISMAVIVGAAFSKFVVCLLVLLWFVSRSLLRCVTHADAMSNTSANNFHTIKHFYTFTPPVMVNKFLNVPGSYQWAGISTLVSTLLIVMAAFIQRFGTLPPSA